MNINHHETEEYLKLCYSIIMILQGYFRSEEYLNIIKSSTQKLLDLYSNSVIFPQISYYKDNIILDLDETLIHSETPINFDKSYNYIISEKNIGLFVRPYLIEMLKEISEFYNIFLFSAGEADYVKCVLDKIGCHSYFSLVLSREFCISPIEDLYVKDLNMFQDFINEYTRRNPSNLLDSKIEHIIENIDLPQETIIADNHLVSFSNNLSQGVLVNDYFGDQEDDELLALSEFLTKLKKAKHDSGVSLSFLLNKSFDYSSY
jgi:TFIIF-interacting CTD phosphatase-like protein